MTVLSEHLVTYVKNIVKLFGPTITTINTIVKTCHRVEAKPGNHRVPFGSFRSRQGLVLDGANIDLIGV